MIRTMTRSCGVPWRTPSSPILLYVKTEATVHLELPVFNPEGRTGDGQEGKVPYLNKGVLRKGLAGWQLFHPTSSPHGGQ